MLLAVAMLLTAATKQRLVLYCTVTRASPNIDPVVASWVRVERYRFTLPAGGGSGVARTPRARTARVKVIESENEFRVDFENKRVFIDRTTAEFQLFIRGSQLVLGYGTCSPKGERQF